MTKKTGTMYLVFKPVLRDEESEEAYMVCPNETTANACAEKVNAFLKRLKDRLPELPVDVEDPNWDKAWQKRYDLIDRARWPYGINLAFELNEHGPVLQVRSIELRWSA